MIRVVLPFHLRNLAQENKEVLLQVAEPVTQRAVLDALEAAYPVLRGTIRNQATQERRAFVRFFADGEDWSHVGPDELLPTAVVMGREPFRIIGAMAGG